jgi:succinoglycan biosynthesis protein ExoO
VNWYGSVSWKILYKLRPTKHIFRKLPFIHKKDLRWKGRTMDNKPRVSVIITAYNMESYIKTAVTSALKQSVEDIEVIVVDDASTDGTALVVKELRDHRMKLFQNKQNMGPSSSRNLGIMQAEGEWIAILDADDWWESDRLAVLLEAAQQEGAHIVCDDLYLIEDGADSPWNTYLKSRERAIGPIDAVTTVTPVKMIADDYGLLKPIIRMDFLNKFGARYKEHLIFAEDYVFVLHCLIYGAKMVIFPGEYYYYRSRAGTLTNSPIAIAQAHHDLLLELFNK